MWLDRPRTYQISCHTMSGSIESAVLITSQSAVRRGRRFMAAEMVLMFTAKSRQMDKSSHNLLVKSK